MKLCSLFYIKKGDYMNIQKIKIDKLIPAEYNPRIELKENDRAYKQIKASIDEFGYVSPIIVNKRNMVVISGHQRLNILKNSGFKEVQCVFVDVDNKTEKRMNLAFNNNDGYWDNDKLREMFADLELTEEEMFATGFNVEEIESYNQDFIDDLFNEDFTNRGKIELKEFAITFNIDKKYEKLFNNYIKINGKSNLIEAMINYIEESEVD